MTNRVTGHPTAVIGQRDRIPVVISWAALFNARSPTGNFDGELDAARPSHETR